METYSISTEITYCPSLDRLPPDPNPDYLTTLVSATGSAEAAGYLSNQPNIETAAMWALYNGKGSGKIVHVHHLTIDPLQGRTGTAAQTWGIQRCSALGGGVDVSGEVQPMDTNNAAIPSQVLFRDGCSATLTGATFRRILDNQMLNPTRATMYPCWLDPSSNNAVMSTQRGLTDCQGQVLREGEGLVILTTGSTSRENWVLAIQVFINIGSSTYMLRRLVQTGMWDGLLGIYNGSGSGVVLEVRDITVTEVTSDETTLRRYELGTISGLHPNSKGKILTLDPFDSTNSALPPEIVSCLRPTVLQIGPDSSYGVARPNHVPLRRYVGANNGVGPGLAALLDSMSFKEALHYDSSAGYGHFHLREGEGIAFFQRNDFGSRGSGYYLACIIMVEDSVTQQISPILGSTIIRGPQV